QDQPRPDPARSEAEDDLGDDAGQDEQGNDASRGVGPPGGEGGDRHREAAEHAGDDERLGDDRRKRRQVIRERAGDVGGQEDPADEEDRHRQQEQDEQGDAEPGEPGESVVAAAERTGEVEGENAVALVPGEQLRRLRGAEQGDEDRDRPVVRVVAERDGALERLARAEPGGDGQDSDDDNGGQDRQDAQDDRRNL